MQDKALVFSNETPKEQKNDAKDQNTRWRRAGAGNTESGKRGRRVGRKEDFGVKVACHLARLKHKDVGMRPPPPGGG